jgi:N-acetyl sugar amidotransferase
MTPLWSTEMETKVRAAAKNIDAQVQDQPPAVKFCIKCVISNQRPRIVFDEDGVCSACRFAEYKQGVIFWTERELQLEELLNRDRRSHGYDCLVPASGGKDSAFTAHVLKHQYGMNPLCPKFGPFLYTDIGRSNWEAFNHAGFDTIEMRPNGLLHRKLARLAFEFIGDPFLPFVYGQLAYPMRLAQELGISLVIYGENGEAEYGGDSSANDKPSWDVEDWDRVYQKGASISRLLQIGSSLGALTREEMFRASQYYTVPDRSLLEYGGVQFHWLGYYKKWHPQSNFYHAAEHCGFEANPAGRSEGTYSKYASLDDKMDGLHYWMAMIKFGLGRCSSDAAHEIRDGDITREEAVALVHKYDHEFPTKHLDECLEYMGMEEDHLDTVMDRFKPQHLWFKNRLKHQVA